VHRPAVALLEVLERALDHHALGVGVDHLLLVQGPVGQIGEEPAQRPLELLLVGVDDILDNRALAIHLLFHSGEEPAVLGSRLEQHLARLQRGAHPGELA